MPVGIGDGLGEGVMKGVGGVVGIPVGVGEAEGEGPSKNLPMNKAAAATTIQTIITVIYKYLRGSITKVKIIIYKLFATNTMKICLLTVQLRLKGLSYPTRA